MLRTRVLVGTILAAVAAVALLLGDNHYPQTLPFLFAFVLVLGVSGTRELVALMPNEDRPQRGLTTLFVLSMLVANWVPQLHSAEAMLALLAGITIVAFIVEIVRYDGSGSATRRIANTVFTVVYLGVLPSFLIRIRQHWYPAAFAATILIPKLGDVGAYFSGRAFGRTPMAPRLSPKKTWEGFAGGLLAAVSAAVTMSQTYKFYDCDLPGAIVFGLCVGLAGVVGDLAESMIKRGAKAKDASASVPGFGGVLDVIDSLLFAAPVAWLVLKVQC